MDTIQSVNTRPGRALPPPPRGCNVDGDDDGGGGDHLNDDLLTPPRRRHGSVGWSHSDSVAHPSPPARPSPPRTRRFWHTHAPHHLRRFAKSLADAQAPTSHAPPVAFPGGGGLVPPLAGPGALSRWGSFPEAARPAFALFQARFHQRATVQRMREALARDLRSPASSGTLTLAAWVQGLLRVHDPFLPPHASELDATIALVRFVRRAFPADLVVAQVALLHNFGKLLSLGARAWPPAYVFGESRLVQPTLLRGDMLLSDSAAAVEWAAQQQAAGGADGGCRLPMSLAQADLTLNHAVEAGWMLEPWLRRLPHGQRVLAMLTHCTHGAYTRCFGQPQAHLPLRLHLLETSDEAVARGCDMTQAWLVRGLRALAAGHEGVWQFRPSSARARAAAIKRELLPLWVSIFGAADAGPWVRMDPRDIAAQAQAPRAAQPLPPPPPRRFHPQPPCHLGHDE